jgi:hypothetical protein
VSGTDGDRSPAGDADRTAPAEPAGPAGGGPGTAPAYRERLWPSGEVWAAAAVLALGCTAIALPLGTPVAAGVLTVVTAALIAALLAGSPTVEVAGGGLRAGRARIPVRRLGAVEVLDGPAMRRARGPQLNARAYLCLRGWVPGGVRVEITDPADPAPYWLLSSRSPRSLAEALRTADAPD